VDFLPILETLVEHECRIVVIGSTARRLTGEAVLSADVDLMVSAPPSDRPPLRDALSALGATTQQGYERRPVARATSLPWDWGWKVSTGFGDIDVIIRLIDDTTIVEHEALALDCALPSGAIVRCHPTRFDA
jgi:hypothetical protein